MKKCFFVIWDDPKFYQTIIFLSQYLSKKNYKIYIIHKKPKKNFIGNINFGKNTKLISYSFNFKIFSNYFNYLGFVLFAYLKFINIKPEKIIFFNRYALLSLFFLNFFKKKDDKFIYHNFDFEDPKNFKSLKEKILYKLEIFICKYVDYLIFPSKKRGNLFKKFYKAKNLNILSFSNYFPINFKFKNTDLFKKFLNKNNISKKKNSVQIGYNWSLSPLI